jgi:hypothetical protein
MAHSRLFMDFLADWRVLQSGPFPPDYGSSWTSGGRAAAAPSVKRRPFGFRGWLQPAAAFLPGFIFDKGFQVRREVFPDDAVNPPFAGVQLLELLRRY